jgi:hypothetical protein
VSLRVDQVTGRRDAGEQLRDGSTLAADALAQFRAGNTAQAFRLVTRARLALAAAQGELTRAARAEFDMGPVTAAAALAAKPRREQGGCPA